MKCPKCGYQSFNFLTDCKKCGRDLTETQEKFGFNRLGWLEGPAAKKTSEPAVINPVTALAAEAATQPNTPPQNELLRDEQPHEDLEVFFQSIDNPPGSNSSAIADFVPGEELPPSHPFQPTTIEPGDTLPESPTKTPDFEQDTVGGELFPFDEMDADLDALQHPLEETNKPFLLDIAFDEFDELSLKADFSVPAASLAEKHDSPDCAENASLPAAVEKGVPPTDSRGLPAHLPETPTEKEYFFSFQGLAEDLAALPGAQAPSLDWDRSAAENAFGPTQDKNIGETVSASGHRHKEKWSLPEPPAAQSPPAKDFVPGLEFESLDTEEPVKTIGSPAWPASANISTDFELPAAPTFTVETDSPDELGMVGRQTPPRVALTLRLWAFLADFGALSSIFFLFILAGEMVRSPQGAGWFVFTPEALLDLATPYFLVLFVLCFGYFTLFHYLTGQTPGKMLWNIRVEDETGESLSLSQAFLRTVGGLAALLPAGLGLLSIPMNSCRRGWNDRLANSRVVIVEKGGEKEARG